MPGARSFPTRGSTSPRTCSAGRDDGRRSSFATRRAAAGRCRGRAAGAPRCFAAALMHGGVGQATGSPATCRIFQRPSWRRWALRRSAPCGRRARRTSACRGYSIASARLRRSSCSADGYGYGGKTHDSLGTTCPRSRAQAAHRPRVSSSSRMSSRSLPIFEPDPRAPSLACFPVIGSAAGPCAFERFPFDHPLYILYLVRHHGRAEVHRARRRRNAAAASEGASAPLRHLRRRPHLLLHHLRLDDVELARLGARLGGDADAVGRVARPPATPTRCSIWRTQTRVTLFGTSAKFIDAIAKAGVEPAGLASASTRCGRSRRPARRWPPRASTTSTSRSSADVHLASISGGTDIVALLRRRQSDRAGLARRDPGAGSSACGRGIRRRGPPGAGAEGRAGVHAAVSVDAARLLERSGRPQVPRRVLRALSRACGITATTSS